MKIKYRIALLFSTLTAVVICLLGVFVYFLAMELNFSDYYKRLEIRAVIAAKAYFSENDDHIAAFNEIREKHLERLPEEKDFFLKLEHGNPLHIPKELRKLPKGFFKTVLKNQEATTWNENGLYSGILYNHQGERYIVVVSAQNDYGLKQLSNLKKILFIGGGLSVLLVMIVSFVFAEQILKPIRNIIIKARDVSVYNMHERLHSNDKDEIDELANTINNMLDRLETAFESQNNFVSNASHELRTPLTTIIGEADWALSKSRTEEEYKQVLHIIADQAERLKHLSTSLLKLAQSSFDGKKQDWKTILAEELLWSVKLTVDEITPANTVVYDLNDPSAAFTEKPIWGNEALLHLAITNIIINGCKYSNNKEVLVTLRVAGNYILITIKDDGIGIPQKDLAYVFDPFYRGSNTSSFEGYGVGLPLSNNIIRLHSGYIKLHSGENKGTTVTIKLPLHK